VYTTKFINCIVLIPATGMHTWFAAAADPRIAVAVPLIGVQVNSPQRTESYGETPLVNLLYGVFICK
jgi:hypothetical protein